MNKENLDISRFKDNIKKIYPCGEKRVGVPYAKDLWNSGEFLEKSSKARIVEGPAAKKIAENVKKLDEKEGVLSKLVMAMKGPFRK
ncbi:MAG: hypothetical protein IKA03_04705 [Alphaproteobacteria bacterium]|nr:hypothetical protein [Alphaproteobacteria bacterium]